MWSIIHEAIWIIQLGQKGYYGKEIQERINETLREKDIDRITDFLLSPHWEIKG